MTAKERKTTLKLINAAIKKFPKVMADEEKNHEANEKVITAFMPMARRLKKQVDRNKKILRSKQKMIKLKSTSKPIHPWRRCPYGKHWVKDYLKNIEPSKQHPD